MPVIVQKMYILIRKRIWSWLKTFGDKKKTASRGTRPGSYPAKTAWEGFRRGRSRALSWTECEKKQARGKAKREAERCNDPFQGRLLLSRRNRTIYIDSLGNHLLYIVVAILEGAGRAGKRSIAAGRRRQSDAEASAPAFLAPRGRGER